VPTITSVHLAACDFREEKLRFPRCRKALPRDMCDPSPPPPAVLKFVAVRKECRV